MSDTPRKLIIDIAKGTEEYIDLTPAEIEQRELDSIAHVTREQEREAEAERIATLKESAKAKLIAGDVLTEEEAAVLVI